MMNIGFLDYQCRAHETARPYVQAVTQLAGGDGALLQKLALAYTALGLAGEAGELSNKVKKVLRGDKDLSNQKVKEELAEELGDVLWYVAEVATVLELRLNTVAHANILKLRKRAEAGMLKGDGDQR